MSNIALRTGQLPEKMTSLVTGNPPLWITRDRKGIYANQARVLAENIEGRSKRGDEQVSGGRRFPGLRRTCIEDKIQMHKRAVSSISLGSSGS